MGKFKMGDRVQAYQKSKDKMCYGTVRYRDGEDPSNVWVEFDEPVTADVVGQDKEMTVDAAFVNESELEPLSVKEWESLWESGIEDES